DLPPDDGPLVGVGGLADSALEELPVDARPGDALFGLVFREVAVPEDLELDQLVDLTGRERGLVEFDAVLLDAVGGDADHRRADSSWTVSECQRRDRSRGLSTRPRARSYDDGPDHLLARYSDAGDGAGRGRRGQRAAQPGLPGARGPGGHAGGPWRRGRVPGRVACGAPRGRVRGTRRGGGGPSPRARGRARCAPRPLSPRPAAGVSPGARRATGMV